MLNTVLAVGGIWLALNALIVARLLLRPDALPKQREFPLTDDPRNPLAGALNQPSKA